MAISKDEIEKYIFDPENPKQCKSYNLLLKIAKKGSYTYISKDFFSQMFISDDIVNQLEKELWDIPNNYKELSKNEKVQLYIKQFSMNDFLDLLNKIVISNSILKKIFFYIFPKSYPEYLKIIDLEQDYRELFSSYENNNPMTPISLRTQWSELEKENKIFLYNFDTTNILNRENFFQRSTVLVTTLEHKKKFLESNISDNIKPIFLKKIEDVEILLNVLEEDLKKEKQKNVPQEKISTINQVNITNFFSINEIKLNNLKYKKEIYLVGENGDGKTLLLQAIAVALKGTQEDGLKEFRAKEDKFTLEIENKNEIKNNFFAYGASRNNYCQLKKDTTGYLTLFSGEYYLKSPTKWLQYLDYSEQKENSNVITVSEAKKLLQHLLNSDIQIDISPDKVTFTEKGSEVSFEQLSAGYKGVITIICDLIARLSEKQQVEKIADFQGVVLIDEVELHLHPKWQYSFMKKLTDTFPLIQFMVTTHSPTVLLGASEDAVFYKVYKENGKTKISQPMDSIKNLMANSLSTSPLFDMDTARARDNDNNLDTREDFISSKIHNIIKERTKGKKAIVEEEIIDMINQELDDYLKEND